MSKIKIKRNDEFRVLLTELLPYEVPMLFSNEGFYTLARSGDHKPFFDKVRAAQKTRKYTIPFNYEVRKTPEDTRTLSVIHPVNQLEFIDFYKKYDSLMIHLCAKSPFSLRHISKVAKFCYSPDLVFQEDEHKNNDVEVEPEVLDQETRLFKSYFTYAPIDLIYKFYERHEYQRLEQRYRYLMEFDVSKCFYNIYTHTISWAVKGKESAKKNLNKTSFEDAFDKLMQRSNYNETNGIVVGPEISRIFAEIILQEIDVNVLRKLSVDDNKEFGKDYQIRRYVDDFFVFSNDEDLLNRILKAYKKELEKYKLYINTSKTQISRKVPFITNIAVGKREVSNALDDLFNKLVEIETVKQASGETKRTPVDITRISNPRNVAQGFINDFKCIVKRNDLTYASLNKDVIRRIKQILVTVLRKEAALKRKDAMEGFLSVLIETAFYVYSFNITASTTFKISQIVVLICKYLDGKDDGLKHSILSKLAKEIEFSMEVFKGALKPNETNIETLNLLIASKKLGSSYTFSEKKIRELFGLANPKDFSRLNYFQIITFLYYFGDAVDFKSLRLEIERTVIEKFQTEVDPFSKAEFMMLFFDFVACPFVSLDSKKKVVGASSYAKNNVNDAIAKILAQKSWFMSWDIDIDLEGILKKKEWSNSY